MPTDTERREVARRLRSVDVNDILFDSELVDAIEHACGSKRKRRDFGKIIERLADLIEPVERMCLYYDADTNHCGCYDTRLIDRDALLALADEINDTICDNRGELSVSLGDIWGWSQAIREALGVTGNAQLG